VTAGGPSTFPRFLRSGNSLEAALSLQDLAALRGNRLEALKRDRKGHHSIHINEQWRVCFEWP
jgi:proteic killer suppression protein